MKKTLFNLLTFLFCIGLVFNARAEKADADKPTNIEADQMFSDDVKQITTFTGNVVVTKGTLLIKAGKAVIVEDPEGYQFITLYAAPGKLASLRQKQDSGPDTWLEGYGEKIEYDNKNEIAKFFTRARVKRLQGSKVTDDVTGEYISYNAKTEYYNVYNTSEGVSKPGAGRVKAVIQPREKKSNNVSLDVSSGEVVGLLGPNGAGKTTSFYMIVGLVPADDGIIELDGIDLTRLPIHKRASMGLSYLPQEASVFRKLNVEDNIRAVLELQKKDGKPLSRMEIEQKLDNLLAELQIEKLRTNSALSLSGGERRRVEIARALATDPRFILLDEPFAGIDPIAVIEIQRIVRFLKERGIGVLITDHNVRETLGICDHAYIINQGTVLASGHPDEIIENESVRRVYLGEHFRM